MARSYVTTREDAFSGQISRQVANLREVIPKTGSRLNVRRPLVGMSPPQETYSTITVRSASGMAPLLIDTSEPVSDWDSSSMTSNLIIQSISERREEKQQILETFGEDVVYFYGERPVLTTFTAILPESEEFTFAQEFWRNYEKVLRGTSAVTKKVRAYVECAGKIFEGYLINAATEHRADQPYMINLTFTLYTTNTAYVSKLRNQRPGEGKKPYIDTDKGSYVSWDDYDDSGTARARVVAAPKELDMSLVGPSGQPSGLISTDSTRFQIQITLPTATESRSPGLLSNALTGLFIAGAVLDVARSVIDAGGLPNALSGVWDSVVSDTLTGVGGVLSSATAGIVSASTPADLINKRSSFDRAFTLTSSSTDNVVLDV